MARDEFDCGAVKRLGRILLRRVAACRNDDNLGLRCAVPNGQLVDALRDEHMLSVAAGDNVVRLVPPLIVSEAEVGDAMGMLDRACARLTQTQKAAKQGAAV